MVNSDSYLLAGVVVCYFLNKKRFNISQIIVCWNLQTYDFIVIQVFLPWILFISLSKFLLCHFFCIIDDFIWFESCCFFACCCNIFLQDFCFILSKMLPRCVRSNKDLLLRYTFIVSVFCLVLQTLICFN